MDPLEKTQTEAAIELEGRLQDYFTEQYGSPSKAGDVWQSVAAQLGAQEGKAPAQVAASLNGAYKGDLAKAGETHDLLRLSPEKPQTSSRRRWSLWSPAIAAALVLALASVLVGLLATVGGIAGVQKPGPNVLPNPSFESGLGDWKLSNAFQYGNKGEFGSGIDTTVAHSGQASAYISSTVANPAQSGTLATNVSAQDLQGKRIMFSAYVKTEGGRTWAQLYMGIMGKLPPALDDAQHETYSNDKALLDMDAMDDRPILGTTGWTRYDIVLDVPTDATEIPIGFSVGGPGRGWLDDVQLSVVGNDVPTTSAFKNSQPVNMGFEDGLTGWRRGTERPFDYATGTDTSVYHGGKASAYIKNLQSDGTAAETIDLHQALNTQDYKGKRVRLSVYVKTENVQGYAQPSIAVHDISGMDVSIDFTKQIHGTTDWQEYTVEADVPENYSKFINLAVALYGTGQVWIDDAQLDVIGSVGPNQATQTPIQATREITITNPGFEDALSGWDYGSQAFVSVVADNSTSHSGKSSASMKIDDPSISSIPMNQSIDATKLRGERVRLTGYIKTKDAGYAGLWMRVDGPVPAGGTYPQTLAFDNMMDRPVVGTNDWQSEAIVLDVPDNANMVVFGAQLIGMGQMWVDDFKLEVVGKDLASTDILTAAAPSNMDFEDGQAHWLPTGGSIQYYQVGTDSQTAHGGSTSGHISSATAPSDKQAGLTQSIDARDYAGKRVRFTAYLKTDSVEGWAGLEIEAVSVWENFSAEDRMERRPLYGTTAWQKYEVVLDIPADSTNIMYGAHLEGRGEIWIDDAQLEVVGNDVPLTTPPALDSATNVGFENELDGWYLDSNAPHSFQIGTNPSTAHGGYQGAYIKVAATADEAMEGGIIQTISAKPYLGKRIRLTGYINAAQVQDRSRLWLHVQTPEAKDAGYVEQERYLIKGVGGYEGGWTECQVEIDVPDTATTISFGVRMSGPGEVWMDDLQIEVEPDATPTP